MSAILGELEQRVMDIMWDSDESMKPAEVLDALCCDLAYTTVMTILKRLSDKGLLKRKKKGKVYYYSAATPKKQFAKNKLFTLFQSVVDSYGDLAISQFIDTVKTSPKDLESLKEYLQDISEDKK